MSLEARRRGQLQAGSILIGALLVVLGALVGFTIAFARPLPTGAWIGFGVVVAVAVLLAGVAVWIVTRSDEPSIEPSARAVARAGEPHHVLVVADEAIGTEELRTRICERTRGCESEVLVVAPALNSPVRHWTDEEDTARTAAEARLRTELEALGALGVRARGEVGADDPMQAIADALRTFPADEIVISTHPADRANWLEAGVVSRAREAYGLPVAHVVGG